MYYIHNKLLGNKSHLCVDKNSTYLVDTIPHLAPIENGTLSPGSLGAFSKILNVDDTLIPDNILKTLEQSNIDPRLAGLSHLVRPDDLVTILAKHKETVSEVFSKSNDYFKRYAKNIAVLNSCDPIKFTTPPEGVSVDSGGLANKIIYDTALTKTGRMKVVSGPNVLTMKKDFKQRIASRFIDGSVIEIDFSALEPRTALAVIGNNDYDANCDIYVVIGNELGISNRNIAKQVVISFLYGAGINTICRLAEIDSAKLIPKLKRLKEIFLYDSVVNSIRSQCTKQGYFTNHAGRPIFPLSDKSGLLFNNFTQSSAVDVALSGFEALLKEMDSCCFKAVPLCFIHDAIIIDVPKDELQYIEKMSKSLSTYLSVNFPTKLKVLNN